LAVQRGYTVFYREAHVLVDDINQARELGELRKYRATIKAADLVVIDDLFLRKLPPNAGDELADLIMSRYEKASTLITSNREIEDWAKLMGDAVIVTPLLDRLMHHGHLLKFVGKSWRLKESADRLAKGRFWDAGSSKGTPSGPIGPGTRGELAVNIPNRAAAVVTS
jgi:DNA replication protein DnaC